MEDVGPGAVSPQDVSDDELDFLAITADPTERLTDAAVPLDGSRPPTGPLPGWYMPVPQNVGDPGLGTKVVALSFAMALIGINALGLCITYGFLEP